MTPTISPARSWKSLFAKANVEIAPAKASRIDRDHAAIAFLGSATDIVAPTPPSGLTVVELVQFYLASGAFKHHVVNAAMTRFDETLSITIPGPTLAWANRRLPLSDATKRRFAAKTNHRDFFQAVFTDPVFLGDVWLTRRQSWSPSIFVTRSDSDEETIQFVETLLHGQSPLLDPERLTAWGLDRLISADNLVRYGKIEGFRTNAIFDAGWYAQRYNTGTSDYFENMRLYVTDGERFGRDPNPFLNMRRYAEAHPDLITENRAGRLGGIIGHLIDRDAGERRTAACHFDADFYHTQVSREAVRRSGSAFAHYVETGWHQGVSPNPCFDPVWYLRNNPDALDAVENGIYPNAFSHFVQIGDIEGRAPCAFFDHGRYAAANGDVAKTKNANLFRHFWAQGRFEARDFGDPVTRAVATYFVKRFPDSLDRVTVGGGHRLSGDPETVLRLSRNSDEAAQQISCS